MSFPDNDELVSDLPEEIRIRIRALAQKLNRSEPEVFKGLINSLLDLIENSESKELTGLAKEAREKFHSRRSKISIDNEFGIYSRVPKH